MLRKGISFLSFLALIQFSLSIWFSPPSVAQEWEVKQARGTIKVVDLYLTASSAMMNCAEGLIGLDKDNNVVPCLARNWRWIDDRTIELRLRRGVTFHNGEEFNADALRVNWEHYRKLKKPSIVTLEHLSDKTELRILDSHAVQFRFPEPEGLVFAKLFIFRLFAPAYFEEHGFGEQSWGFLAEPGPWGTGPFKLVKGSALFTKPSDSIVLEAYEDYWDPRFPMVARVIFDLKLAQARDKAVGLCMETEGEIDIVSRIRPLDTLKVASSAFGKVVKSKDVAHFRGIYNQRKKGSKWKDVRLRRALNHAINRKELWRYAAKGNARNLDCFNIPPEAIGYTPNLTPYRYDTELAKSLLAEAGYPGGFEMTIITHEALKLEVQIAAKMLDRIGVKAHVDVDTFYGFMSKIYVPQLELPPEEQQWDIQVDSFSDFYGHPGATFLSFGLSEESNFRWIEYDPIYENMWRQMAQEVDVKEQESKIQEMVRYVHDKAYVFYLYSPLTLYAVNKEVDFVPQKSGFLRLMETSVTDNHWSLRGQNN